MVDYRRICPAHLVRDGGALFAGNHSYDPEPPLPTPWPIEFPDALPDGILRREVLGNQRLIDDRHRLGVLAIALLEVMARFEQSLYQSKKVARPPA